MKIAADLLKKTLKDGDVLVLQRWQDTILQKCCECGTWHKIKIKRHADESLSIMFTELETEPYVDDNDCSTLVEECNG